MAQQLFSPEEFSGFGASRYHPPAHVPTIARVRGRRPAQLRELIRADAPRLPGVYGMLDGKGVLLYVGKAKCLRVRLLSYFRAKSRDPKAGRILQPTRTILWEEATTEFAALVRELELIQRFRPRYNVQGQPGSRRYNYLCIGRSPAPYAYVTRQLTGKEVAAYGPVVGGGRLADAARRINDGFRLRDCPQSQTIHFADQAELFPADRTPGCLRFDIGACLAPCAGMCSRAAYAARVREARHLLDGRDLRLLDRLEREMFDAATGLQFERATALRDKLVDLRWLVDRLTWLRTARDQHSFVYALPGGDERVLWYLIRRGRIDAVVPAPRDAAARRAAVKLIERVFDGPESPPGTPLPTHQVDSVLLVAAWFRKRPDERDRQLTVDQALEACRPVRRACAG